MSVVSKSARVLSAASLIIGAVISPISAAQAASVPSAVTNLAAKGIPLGFDLTFDAPNAVVEGVTEYDSYISLDKGKTWIFDSSASFQYDEFTAPEDLIEIHLGVYAGQAIPLKPLGTYKLKVVAVNAEGHSADSAIVTAKIPASAPIFGTGSVGADDKIPFKKGVTVRWSPFSNGGKPITSFTVKYRSYSADGTGAWTTFKKVSGSTKQVTIPYSKLKAFKDFEIAVDGTNALGTGSGSAEIKVDAKGNISTWV